MLFYLTFAVMATIWISMKYLNDKDCTDFCKRHYNLEVDSKLMQDTVFDHDFKHFGHVKSKRAAPLTTPVPASLTSTKPMPKEESWGPHQLGIVVPFRNRFEELL